MPSRMPRPPKLHTPDVLRAALLIVDHDGLEALSMRRLGQHLGVEAMSLYRHVSNKSAVLDGIHTLILDEMQLPPSVGDWEQDARSLCLAFRSVLRRHPKALPLFSTRPAVTKGSLRYVEHALGLLAEPFPDPSQRVFAFQALASLCVGQAFAHFAVAEVDPVDYAGLPARTFPALSKLGEAIQAGDEEEEFAFALDALLAGLATLARRTGSG